MVARHLEALDAWDSSVARIYRCLGVAAVALARERAEADPAALDEIETLLTR